MLQEGDSASELKPLDSRIKGFSRWAWVFGGLGFELFEPVITAAVFPTSMRLKL